MPVARSDGPSDAITTGCQARRSDRATTPMPALRDHIVLHRDTLTRWFDVVRWPTLWTTSRPGVA